MALEDLVKPSPAAERPPGIACEKSTRGEGKRCRYAAANGACTRRDEFRCVEWPESTTARSTPLAVHRHRAAKASVSRDLLGYAPPEVASTTATPRPSTPPGPTTGARDATPAVDSDRLLGLC